MTDNNKEKKSWIIHTGFVTSNHMYTNIQDKVMVLVLLWEWRYLE